MAHIVVEGDVEYCATIKSKHTVKNVAALSLQPLAWPVTISIQHGFDELIVPADEHELSCERQVKNQPFEPENVALGCVPSQYALAVIGIVIACLLALWCLCIGIISVSAAFRYSSDCTICKARLYLKLRPEIIW